MAWEKVLYKRQPFSDNYVEPCNFLKDLETNLHRSKYSVKELVMSSVVVVYPFTVVCFFVCLYHHLNEEWISSTGLFILSTSSFIGSTVVSSKGHYLQLFIFLHIFLKVVAPILCTLTSSISLDTLWAMSITMLFVHLVFYGYKRKQELLYNAISLNAAVFAAVCLASTMKTSSHGFVLVSLSAHLFALPTINPFYLTVPLVLGTIRLMMNISYTASYLFVAAIVAMTTVFPLWLYYLQDLKNNIYGPWDEAVVAQGTMK